MSDLQSKLQEILGCAEDAFIIQFDEWNKRYDSGGDFGRVMTPYITFAARYTYVGACKRLESLKDSHFNFGHQVYEFGFVVPAPPRDG